jgi:hypothetical protein
MEIPTKKELAKMIDLVTDDLSKLMDAESLSKADPGAEATGEKTPEGSSTDTPEESASPEAPGGKETAPPSEEAPPADGAPESAPPQGEAPPAEGAPQDDQTDPAADANGTAEALAAEYSKLPPEELKIHFLACKEALMQSLGGDGQGDQVPPEGQPQGQPDQGPPPPEAPAPDTSSAPMAPGMGKSEFDSPDGEKVAVKKSETDMASVFAELETLKKGLKEKDKQILAMETSFGEAAVSLKKLFERGNGLRKSIASTAFTPKPGSEAANPDKIDVSQISRTEALSRLKEVTATSTSLTKSDRDQISKYVFGNCSIDKVEEFLK